MYIKQIIKDNKTYYLLTICDIESKQWCKRFIDKELAELLINNGVKVLKKEK